MLLCHLTARRPGKAKNRKINITMFSTSALCLMHHGNIPVSVSVRDRTRPTCPGVKAKWGRREIRSVYFPTPHTAPSVSLQWRLFYFYDFYCRVTELNWIVDLQSCISFRCTVKWNSHIYTYNLFFLFSHIYHYRVLIRVPCVIL